jgi:hypothetical protein
MAGLRVLLFGILAISFLTFVAFFGSLPSLRYVQERPVRGGQNKKGLTDWASRRTPIGFLHRCLWIYIPRGFKALDKQISGGRISGGAYSCADKVFNDKHPLVTVSPVLSTPEPLPFGTDVGLQIFFLGLITVCSAISVPANWPFLPLHHRVLLPLAIAAPFYYTRLCYVSKPGGPYIYPETHAAQMSNFPFDNALYHPNNMCRTCQRPKPPRSKHCPICKTCVGRADHHCVWVNNCIGRGNHKYFLYLLLSSFFLLVYGAYIHYLTLVPQIRQHYHDYPEWHSEGGWNGEDLMEKAFSLFDGWLDYFGTAVVIGGLARGGVGFLTIMCAPLPLGLFAYHVYLLWAGMTTNESAKWSDLRMDMEDGEVFRARLLPGAAEREYADQLNGSISHYHYSPKSRWPKQSQYLYVRTMDGRPPRNVPEDLKGKIGEASWEQVWSLKDVDNIYDLGFWGNLREVLTN